MYNTTNFLPSQQEITEVDFLIVQDFDIIPPEEIFSFVKDTYNETIKSELTH